MIIYIKYREKVFAYDLFGFNYDNNYKNNRKFKCNCIKNIAQNPIHDVLVL